MTATFTIPPPKPGKTFNIDETWYRVTGEAKEIKFGVWVVPVERLP